MGGALNGFRRFKPDQYVRREDTGHVVTLRRQRSAYYRNTRFMVYVGRQSIGGVRTIQDVERLVAEYIDSMMEDVF